MPMRARRNGSDGRPKEAKTVRNARGGGKIAAVRRNGRGARGWHAGGSTVTRTRSGHLWKANFRFRSLVGPSSAMRPSRRAQEHAPQDEEFRTERLILRRPRSGPRRTQGLSETHPSRTLVASALWEMAGGARSDKVGDMHSRLGLTGLRGGRCECMSPSSPAEFGFHAPVRKDGPAPWVTVGTRTHATFRDRFAGTLP
jgi:hypothetical protein